MKITPKELRQIIKEEYQRTLNEMDDLEQDMYPGADEVSFDDTNRFVKAYNMIADAVENGQLPESVEDAVFDMLRMLDINL